MMNALLEELGLYTYQMAYRVVAGLAEYQTELEMYVAPGSAQGRVAISNESWCYVGSVWGMSTT